MRCSRCGTDCPAGAKFCRQCVAALSSNCPSCGATNPPEHKFCGQCGAQLTPPGFRESAAPNPWTPRTVNSLPGEMKQVTVLFCDIVNSTPLTERLGAEGMRDLVHGFLGSSLAIGKVEVMPFGP